MTMRKVAMPFWWDLKCARLLPDIEVIVALVGDILIVSHHSARVVAKLNSSFSGVTFSPITPREWWRNALHVRLLTLRANSSFHPRPDVMKLLHQYKQAIHLPVGFVRLVIAYFLPLKFLMYMIVGKCL